MSTQVTITITLTVEGDDVATNPEVLAALDSLADVMLVQAEDGLWSLGSPESETDDGPSEYLRAIESASTAVTTTPGTENALRELAAKWQAEAEPLTFHGTEYDGAEEEASDRMADVLRECARDLLAALPPVTTTPED